MYYYFFYICNFVCEKNFNKTAKSVHKRGTGWTISYRLYTKELTKLKHDLKRPGSWPFCRAGSRLKFRHYSTKNETRLHIRHIRTIYIRVNESLYTGVCCGQNHTSISCYSTIILLRPDIIPFSVTCTTYIPRFNPAKDSWQAFPSAAFTRMHSTPLRS